MDWGTDMKKKILVVIILIIAVIAVSLWFMLTSKQDLPEFLLQFKNEEQYPKKNKSDSEYDPMSSTIIYHVADFSENIYDDQTYLDLIGPYAMYYKEDDVEVSLTEQEVEKKGDWALFFYDYFETVKNGDHNTYNSYFFDEYYLNHQKLGEFTMQKIYDIRIEELDINVKLDEKEYAWVYDSRLETKCFNVRYKIRQNNGTFRLGVSSDTYQPQMFILALDKKDNIKIIDIVGMSPTY